MQLSTLYYSPIYHNANACKFFQRSEEEQNILTVESLNKLLAGKKIVKHEVNDDNEGPVIVSAFTTVYIVSALFNLMALAYTDPVAQSLPLCDWTQTFWLNSSNWGRERGTISMHGPCYYERMRSNDFLESTSYQYIPAHKIRDLVICFVFFSVTLAAIGACIRPKIKSRNITRSTDSFNQKLDFAIVKLIYASDLKMEVPAKDIKHVFPYLSKKELPLLNFLQLKKAKKHFKVLFEEHLNKSRYSEKQLAIWRLFSHCSDTGKRKTILAEKTSQAIIGSDPFFFETLVRTLQPLKTDEITTFAEILKSRILTEETASNLSKEKLEFIINNISKNHDLKRLMESATANKSLSDFSVDVYSGTEIEIEIELEDEDKNEDDLQITFQHFLKTGKLTIQNTNECYLLLKMAHDSEKNEIAAFLEKYLITHFAEFLENRNLQALLDELTKNKMDKFKIGIDEHLEKTWGMPLQLPFYSGDFECNCLFAKKNELVILSRSLYNHYVRALNELELKEPASELNALIQKILQQIEELFKEHEATMHAILEEKMTAFLKSSPDRVEQLLTAAECSDNTWLAALIKKVYKEDKIFFSGHMLSPLDDV